MVYPQQTWTVQGEQVFENNGYVLLNPAIKVTSVTFSANNLVNLSLIATENSGVYKHYSSAAYDNVNGEKDVDVVVNAAMAAAFPAATVDPPLEALRS
jgi:hypothetical protein